MLHSWYYVTQHELFQINNYHGMLEFLAQLIVFLVRVSCPSILLSLKLIGYKKIEPHVITRELYMKKTLQLFIFPLLLGFFSGITQVAVAEPDEKKLVEQSVEKTTPTEKAVPSEKKPTETEATEPSEEEEILSESESDENPPPDSDKFIEGVTLQHRLNDDETPLPVKQVKADTVVILEQFKEDIQELLKTNPKPLKITTEIKVFLTEEWNKRIGELPSIKVETNIDAAGKGHSQVIFPAYQHIEAATATTKKFAIDFKGVILQLDFAEDFATPDYHIDIAGLTVEEDGRYKILFDKTTSEGKLDAEFLLTKAISNLAKFEFTNSQNSLKFLLENASSDLSREISKSGLEIGAGNFKLGKFEIQAREMQSKFDRFEMTSGVKEYPDVVDGFANAKFNGAILPKEVVGESLTFHYSGQLWARHFAIEPTKELQKVIRDFEKQRRKGVISKETMMLMWMTKTMEIFPKLAAKSPELSWEELNLKTNYGQLSGQMVVGIDGSKFKSLSNTKSLVNSLKIQTDLTVSKKLLQKMLVSISQSAASSQKPDKSDKKAPDAVEKQAIHDAEAQISELLQQKWLAEEGENYRFVASLKENKLVVNGAEKPSPLDLLLEPEPPNQAQETPSAMTAEPPTQKVKH